MDEYDYAGASGMLQNPAHIPPVHESVDVRLGYAFVPRQVANDRNLYMPEMGLTQGTIFPDLDKRLGVYGEQDLGEGCC